MVREDLPLRHQLVQAAHAAYEIGQRVGNPQPEPDYSVILSVPDEAALLRAYARLTEHGIPTHLFRESDLGDQATALASAPVVGEDRRRFSRYPLWKENACVPQVQV